MAENKNGNNEVKIVEEKGKLAKVKDFFNPKNFKEKHPKMVATGEKIAIAVVAGTAAVIGDRFINGRRKTGTAVIDTDDYYIEDTGVDTGDEAENN